MPGKKKSAPKKSNWKKLPVRLPLPKKPGRPMGPPAGEKAYDRKREREEIERECDDEE